MSDPCDLDVAELERALEAGEAPLVVDTRSRAEYEAGHVPGAVHLPFWRAGARHAELDADPGTHLLLYCGHGPRASLARAALRRRGYTRVGLLRGHFSAWRQQRGAAEDD